MDSLNRLGSLHAVALKYYGEADPKTEEAFYDADAPLPGWYETDKSLRARVIEAMSKPKQEQGDSNGLMG